MNPGNPVLPSALPAHFESFWAEVLEEALDHPLDFSTHNSVSKESETHLVKELTFRGADGTARHGWVADPVAPIRSKSAGFLWLPPYGRWSMQPNQYGTRPGLVSWSFNFHGKTAFHQESYTPRRGYFTDGIASPHTFIFRRMAQDAILAWRMGQELDQVDPSSQGIAGMSQGGGIALWLATMDLGIKAVQSDMPFLAGVDWIFQHHTYRYPLKEIADAAAAGEFTMEEMLHTLRYFDLLHFAPKVKCPVFLSLGLKDPAVRPAQVRAVAESLPALSHMIEIEGGHDWHPDMRRSDFIQALNS